MTMILMYHNISEKSSFNSVSVTEFQKQMDYITNCGKYTVLSLDEYVENLLNTSFNKSITVTFDDGYVSLVSLVLPIINKYKIPITVFIPVEYVGAHNVWDTKHGHPRIDILDWEYLYQLSREKFVSIGSHGVNHISHANLNKEDDYFEILKSKEVLEEKLGIEVNYYSYPYGQIKDIGTNSIDNLKEVGYKAALSTNWSRRNSKKTVYHLNRLEILETDDLNTFTNKLESKIDVRSYKQKLKNILSISNIMK